MMLKLIPHLDYFIDIGANCGYFTLLVATNSDENVVIHSFEPHSRAYCQLKNTVSEINRKRIHLHNKALGAESGTGILQEHILGSAGSTLTNIEYKNRYRSNQSLEKVSICSLDDVWKKEKIKGCVLIKIDVEGYEYQVLTGAEKYLSSAEKPILIIEVQKDHKKTQQRVLQKLKEYGYDLYPIEIYPKQRKQVIGAEITQINRAQDLNNVLAISDAKKDLLEILRTPIDLRIFTDPSALERYRKFLADSTAGMQLEG